MLIYLHGFRSSPLSFKARIIAERLAAQGRGAMFACPQLPPSPHEAVALVRAQFAPGPDDTLVGSSLGGYYATWLAEAHGCRAVLLNPAVQPGRDLAPYVGALQMYHSNEPFEFRASHVAELRALEAPAITHPERYFLVAAKGDEVIDWRDMVARYPGVETLLLEGSDHGLSDFASYCDRVIAFARLAGSDPEMKRPD